MPVRQEQRRRFVTVLFATALLFGCALTKTPEERLEGAYTRSIAEAAVKTPASVRTLTPIDLTQREITVAHLQPYPTIDASRYIWISLPDELRKFCKNKNDKLLALEMALGLPPDPQEEKVFLFRISPADSVPPLRQQSGYGDDILLARFAAQCTAQFEERAFRAQADDGFLSRRLPVAGLSLHGHGLEL